MGRKRKYAKKRKMLERKLNSKHSILFDTLTQGDRDSCVVFLEADKELCKKYIELKKDNGKNILHYACIGGSVDCTELMLEYDKKSKISDLWKLKDRNGNTPFHNAAANGHSGLVEWIISKNTNIKEKLEMIYNTNNDRNSAIGLCTNKNTDAGVKCAILITQEYENNREDLPELFLKSIQLNRQNGHK